jgi:RNA ligase (TIGR02306 family)
MEKIIWLFKKPILYLDHKIKVMQNQNSVAFVAKIDSIVPIPGADNIEQAFIGGWSCIIKKDQHKVNELVICATTDAVIPQRLADSMGVTGYLRSGTRIRTVKLRGVYSECLIIPTHYTKGKLTMGHNDLKEGQDMMQTLEIFKYEPPAKHIQLSSGKKIKYHENPNFHIYHKFPNIKNVKGMFTEEDTVQITRKIHGTNARYGIIKKKKLSILDRIKKFFGNKWAGYEYVVGSHNVEKGSDSQGFYDTNAWYQIADKYNIKEKLWNYIKMFSPKDIGSGFTIYGEIYGAGIQKNYEYGLKDIEFCIFDCEEDSHYFGTKTTKAVVDSILKLPHVDVLYRGLWSQEIQDKFTFNNFIDGTKVPHEGIVVKHISGERDKVAKVINPDYLIYGEKHDVGDSH